MTHDLQTHRIRYSPTDFSLQLHSNTTNYNHIWYLNLSAEPLNIKHLCRLCTLHHVCCISSFCTRCSVRVTQAKPLPPEINRAPDTQTSLLSSAICVSLPIVAYCHMILHHTQGRGDIQSFIDTACIFEGRAFRPINSIGG